MGIGNCPKCNLTLVDPELYFHKEGEGRRSCKSNCRIRSRRAYIEYQFKPISIEEDIERR